MEPDTVLLRHLSEEPFPVPDDTFMSLCVGVDFKHRTLYRCRRRHRELHTRGLRLYKKQHCKKRKKRGSQSVAVRFPELRNMKLKLTWLCKTKKRCYKETPPTERWLSLCSQYLHTLWSSLSFLFFHIWTNFLFFKPPSRLKKFLQKRYASILSFILSHTGYPSFKKNLFNSVFHLQPIK